MGLATWLQNLGWRAGGFGGPVVNVIRTIRKIVRFANIKSDHMTASAVRMDHATAARIAQDHMTASGVRLKGLRAARIKNMRIAPQE